MALTRHEEYVAKGYCPSMHLFKAWCCFQQGHRGQHMALRLLPSNTFVSGLRWD